MKRILIVGSGGAGKTTFSKRLSEKTGLELIHLDQIYWQPNWTKPDKTEWRAKLAELAEKDFWIMDGNYDSSMEIRLKRCDTVIFLDMPRILCLYRVCKRVAKYRNTNRPDMAEGCNEKIDWEFIKWIWEYPKKDKLHVESLLKRYQDSKTIIYLKSKKEVESFFTDYSANTVKSF